ncbi:MAG: hypothetical protein OEZ34_03580 [Spirochaetia bacterium]|nr:hypothetical protein [Spirochaetia bacterium]
MRMDKWIFIFLPILLLTVISSLVSLLNPDFYFRDSEIMAAKSHYLDLINLFIVVPAGLVLFFLVMKGSYWAKLSILGIMAYLAFMFGFNALSLFFNKLFLVYIALFSLNIFGILFGYNNVRQSGTFPEDRFIIKVSAVLLMLFAVPVYFFWLIEVIASTVNNTVPETISNMNIPANVVHVFDMGFALPVIIYGSVLLLKGKNSGLVISAIMATFVFFICISLLGMEVGLHRNNLHFDQGILVSAIIMTPLSVFPLVTLSRAVSKYFPGT